MEVKDLAELHELCDQERHALSAAPHFVNPELGDFRLRPDSPLIERGVVIPGINDCGEFRYRGAAPDIGAFEAEPAQAP